MVAESAEVPVPFRYELIEAGDFPSHPKLFQDLLTLYLQYDRDETPTSARELLEKDERASALWYTIAYNNSVDPQPVGFASLSIPNSGITLEDGISTKTFDGKTAILALGYVTEAARKQHCFTDMVGQLLRKAKEAGCTHVFAFPASDKVSENILRQEKIGFQVYEQNDNEVDLVKDLR